MIPGAYRGTRGTAIKLKAAVIASFLLLISTAYAESSKYRLANDYIQALGLLKEVSDRAKQIEDDAEFIDVLAGANRNVIKSNEALSIMSVYANAESMKDFDREYREALPEIVANFKSINELHKAGLAQFVKLSNNGA